LVLNKIILVYLYMEKEKYIIETLANIGVEKETLIKTKKK
jgi:hypothetical protein